MSSSKHPFTFKKEERLSSKKLIDELFKDGSSFYLQPFKILILEKKTEVTSSLSRSNTVPAQILIAVSTKNFKRAVDRNKIKRLIREAYRLNKQVLFDSLKGKATQLVIGFLYTSKTIESFSLIQEKVILVMKKLAAQNATATKNID